LGYGSVRTEVSATMDFDRYTTNSEIYDPDSQVVRSTQTIEENSDSADGATSQAVTVTNNLPDPGVDGGEAGSGTSERSARTEETVNYEISKKIETHVREAGLVRRLSIAVLVDGMYEPGADGTPTYRARTAEELAQIEKLVRSAAGIDAERGDTVEIVNMRFTQEVDLGEPVDDGMMGLDKGDFMRIGELLILGLLGALALLFIGKPMISRLLPPLSAAAQAGANLLTAAGGMAALSAPGQASAGKTDAEQMIDVNQVQGRVKASSLKKIAEIVENHPEEAVNIVRSWMTQG
jgi:flagellar M-ring protein FliF